MNFSKDFIKKVLEATNLVELISESGINLKRSGSNFKGLCPFHSEKTPSFSVNPTRGYFHCFGCKKSGDGIKFLIEHGRFSFTEAIKELAKRSNIPLEKNYIKYGNQNVLKDEGIDCLKEAELFYKEKLSTPAGEMTIKYLQKRNIPNSMWKKFNLGASLNEWQGVLTYLKQQKKKINDVSRTGLIKYSEKSGRYYDTFRSRLMFPIKDLNGRCIGFGARAINPDDKPKYINSNETVYYRKSHVLYGFYEGLYSIRKLRRLIFVEGYLDVIRLHENGYEEAVATCGTALSLNHFKIIKRYVDSVILIFDGDNAGIIAALRYSHLLLSQPFESYVVSLPKGEDPDSFLLKNGKESFQNFLEEKISTLDYLVKETLKKFTDSVQGRMQCLDEMLPSISKISDLKRRQLAIIAISERMKIPSEIVTKELKIKSNKDLSKSNNNGTFKRLSDNSSESQDEIWLLQSMLRKGDLWPLVREHLKPEEFHTPHFRKLYAKLLEFPDSEFKPFEPLKFEKSDPSLFQAVMFLLKEEIGSHDFGLSLLRIKVRNLDLNFRESILKSKSVEEQAKIGSMRREEEKKLKVIRKIFDNLSTF
tara:strand:- start:531 stop:2300 length:1770 start_codon:yes stop_codon:yes gene_type:complete